MPPQLQCLDCFARKRCKRQSAPLLHPTLRHESTAAAGFSPARPVPHNSAHVGTVFQDGKADGSVPPSVYAAKRMIAGFAALRYGSIGILYAGIHFLQNLLSKQRTCPFCSCRKHILLPLHRGKRMHAGAAILLNTHREDSCLFCILAYLPIAV